MTGGLPGSRRGGRLVSAGLTMDDSCSCGCENVADIARQKVRTYITDNFLIGAVSDIEDSTPLMESGVLDSTGAMELVAFLEKCFGITIEEDEIVPENLNSIDSICAFVIKKSD